MKPKTPTVKKVKRKVKRKPPYTAQELNENNTAFETTTEVLATIPRGVEMTVDVCKAITDKYRAVGRMLTDEEVKDILHETGTSGYNITASTAKMKVEQFEEGDPIVKEALERIRQEYSCSPEPVYQKVSWIDAEGNVLKWNGEKYERVVSPIPSTAVAIILCAVIFGAGFLTGLLVKSHPFHEPQLIYRNQPLVNELAENPWAAQKLPLLPEDIEVIHDK